MSVHLETFADPTEVLNRDCFCISADRARLEKGLEGEPGGSEPGLAMPELLAERPHLFASVPVFVAPEHIATMRRTVTAIEAVAATEAYRERVLAPGPDIARYDSGARGVLFSYDFHLGANGPRLIEVNTNAGGALLQHYLDRSQVPCCDEIGDLFSSGLPHGSLSSSGLPHGSLSSSGLPHGSLSSSGLPHGSLSSSGLPHGSLSSSGLPHGSLFAPVPDLELELLAMFEREWQLAGSRRVNRTAPRSLARVAIVDREPQEQFLYPEMLLFARLFRRHGIEAIVVDPSELLLDAGVLTAQGKSIDLVYNRTTDFYLSEPGSRVLFDAHSSGASVVTPNPRSHALFANKRNLGVLSDARHLEELGVEADIVDVLREVVPMTTVVTRERAEDLWARRRQLFFKPFAGHASKGAYRGSKLTKRVFQTILAGEYVAQEMVPPSVRTVAGDSSPIELKTDLRCFVYDGRVLSIGARLYRGQTTNMRTENGGLATVLSGVLA